jgi:hypothetical protein
VPVYFGNSCDGGGGGGGGGGSSGGGGGDCRSQADPGSPTFKTVCGAVVTLKEANFTAPCAGHYTNWTWCETRLDLGGGVLVPTLKRVDTYIFNSDTCQFELFMATPDVRSCPGGGGAGSSTTGGNSSTNPTNASSSSSGCTPLPVSIGYSVATNSAPLNQFKAGSTATVTVLVSNPASAEQSGVTWSLQANGVKVKEITVSATDPNPQTFTLSAEDLPGHAWIDVRNRAGHRLHVQFLRRSD